MKESINYRAETQITKSDQPRENVNFSLPRPQVVWERVNKLFPFRQSPERTAKSLRLLISEHGADETDEFLQEGTFRLNKHGRETAKDIFDRMAASTSPSNLGRGLKEVREENQAEAASVKKRIRSEVVSQWREAGRKRISTDPDFKAEVKTKVEEDERYKRLKLQARFLSSIAQRVRASAEKEKRDKIRATIIEEELIAARDDFSSKGKNIPPDALLKTLIVRKRLSQKNAPETAKSIRQGGERLISLQEKIAERSKWLESQTRDRLASLDLNLGRQKLENLKSSLSKNKLVAGLTAVGVASTLYLAVSPPHRGMPNYTTMEPNGPPKTEQDAKINPQEGKEIVIFDNSVSKAAEKSNQGVNPPVSQSINLAESPNTQSQLTPSRGENVLPNNQPPENRKTDTVSDLMRYLKENPNFHSQAEKEQFIREVIKMASYLDPENNNPKLARDLMDVMFFESGISPKRVNRESGATGLIQFLPQTAKALGTSPKELETMTSLEQLKYVKLYFEPYKGQLKRTHDVFGAVFAPISMGEEPNFVVYRRGSIAYRQNQIHYDPEGKGYITMADVVRTIKNYTEKRLNVA